MPHRAGRDNKEPLPFDELFAPLVRRARERLRSQVCPALYNLLTPEAYLGWERYLVERLTGAGASAALWQFQIYKIVRTAFSPERPATQAGTDHVYRAFIGQDPAERLQKLFTEFPGLAGLCDHLEENWLSTVIEFLTRLEKDCGELGDRFRAHIFALPVVALQAGLSDPHNGGRCVAKLHFQNGALLVYKPRSLAPEVHFYALIDTMQCRSPRPLRAAHGWDRGEYGWMENISPSPCGVPSDVHAFYWRAGVLLGLVYLARGVDIHRENLIAAGEHPILIDLEALGHPVGDYEGRNEAAARSVLRTGFLPHRRSPSETGFGWSALSQTAHAERSATRWVNINQDNMVQSVARAQFKDHAHLATHAGEPMLASEYAPDIKAGFRWVGETVLGDQAASDEFTKWMSRLLASPRRLIIGSTVNYQAIIQEHTLPQVLRKKAVGASANTNPQGGKSKREHETTALEQLDVPYFSLSEWNEEHPTESTFHLPTSGEYLAQEIVITRALLGATQAWQDPKSRHEPTK